MIKKDFVGDYLGFTYRDKHSAEFNIVRTSNGNRFNETVLPLPNRASINRSGKDGLIPFYADYPEKKISFQIAYDSLEESDLRNMQDWLSKDNGGWLILDERPYIKYWCQVSGGLDLQYIPFDDISSESGRVYKGEGSLEFTCYEGYGVQSFKQLSTYNGKSNSKEWEEASGIKDTLNGYDKFVSGRCNLYNPGVIPSDLIIPKFKVLSNSGYQVFNYYTSGDLIRMFVLDLSKLPLDVDLCIDGEKKIIYEVNNREKIYNLAIKAGDFIAIKGDKNISQYLTMSPDNGSSVQIEQNEDGFDIEYNYFYY